MTVINLRERKAVLENLISNLQGELDYINRELVSSEKATTVEGIEKDLLMKNSAFSVSKQAVENKIIKVAMKAAKVTKKEKLTKSQQEVMDAIIKAQAYYSFKYNEGLRTLNYFVNSDLYINGKNVHHVRSENGVKLVYDKAYYFGNGEYGYKMSSNTLRALERKGYINVIKEVGNGLDIFTLVEKIEAPKVYEEFSCITYDYGCKYGSKQKIFCPVGQEDMTDDTIKKYHPEWKVIDIELQSVSTWNGR